MNVGKAFFDTNVLLYVYSSLDPGKQAKALALYREHGRERRIVLSTQVVQEFFVSGLRKLALPRQEIREITLTFLDLPLVTIGPLHIRAAMDAADRYQISFWDALIIAAAESGGADVLFTEDLNHGQRYGRVLAQNPFLPV